MEDDLEKLQNKLKAVQQPKKATSGNTVDADNMNVGIRAGSELVISIVASAAIGYGLDQWLGTKPWCLLVLLLLGVGAGFMAVYRITNKAGGAVGFAALQNGGKSDTKPPEISNTDDE